MSLFHHKIRLSPVDPLGDGLRDDIAAEQAEPEHITLEDGIDADELNQQWNNICSDLKNDPMWFADE